MSKTKIKNRDLKCRRCFRPYIILEDEQMEGKIFEGYCVNCIKDLKGKKNK